jgi:hypothetical protein
MFVNVLHGCFVPNREGVDQVEEISTLILFSSNPVTWVSAVATAGMTMKGSSIGGIGNAVIGEDIPFNKENKEGYVIQPRNGRVMMKFIG